MGLAGEKGCRCVSTLEAIAHNFYDKDAVVIPALDARRNQVYTAVFKCENGAVSRIEDDCAMAVEQTLETIKKYCENNKVYIAGDGAYLFNELICGLSNVEIANNELLYPQADGITRAASNVKPIAAKDIKLSYLRLSQAERELKEKQKND
jgi:tRNA threonylcarbamoyladenosine biosynthesis protein TsaB